MKLNNGREWTSIKSEDCIKDKNREVKRMCTKFWGEAVMLICTNSCRPKKFFDSNELINHYLEVSQRNKTMRYLHA